MLDAKTFDSLKITLATSDDIASWSHGEVKKPETINYRTLKPERDGLFGEQIFGPTRDWECACGKYKRVRYKGIVCEKCGVEVTRSKVRRERMGHIDLAAPVTHIWYFKGVPSRLGYVLNLAPKDLEKVIYFAAYMVTEIDEKGRDEDLMDLRAELEVQKKQMEDRRDDAINQAAEKLEADLAALEADGASAAEREKLRKSAEKDMTRLRKRFDGDIDGLEVVWDNFTNLKVGALIGDERLYRAMVARYGTYFKGDMGAAAIQKRLETFDLEAEVESLRQTIASDSGPRKARAIKRLKVINAFIATGNSPASMVLTKIPVIPPDLRPMVQLDGGRFATSDLNDLYRRVINRNTRLKRLLELGAPDVIVANEKRMLQESVDALFDNGRRGRPVAGPGNRPLKSISDMLKGKQGRFRQNLLGKRVDYSGRSVIVVGPQLKLHQCGLPKQMALELFKPFVMKRLVEKNYAQNVKAAKRKVERQRPEVWDVLDDVIREHPVLLNRAPTLHRLGIQAFEPQLIEGKAIQLHPLACGAFNADFDGDQMAVHLPLGAEAQAEARILMLSTNNILKPSDGRPVAMPSQDMIIGLFHLTSEPDSTIEVAKDSAGNPIVPSFSSAAEAIMAFDMGLLDLNAKALIRFDGIVPPADWEAPEGWEPGDDVLLETSLGRAIFNEQLPVDYPFVNEVVGKKQLGQIVNTLTQRYPNVLVAECLDALKSAGFHWSTWSGITIAFSDIQASPRKEEILAEYEARAAKIQEDFDAGFILEENRYKDLVDLWLECTQKVADDMRGNFDDRNTVYRMVNSGARGNWSQVQQIAGMRGLVSDPKQKLIERPIKANYREGLTVLEYFIATHGARKGLADTALRTAESGYLTRRLVDVSQDVIVREEDCGTRQGVKIKIAKKVDGVWEALETVETTAYARNLARDAVNEAGEVVMPAGTDLGDDELIALAQAGVEEITCRSVLTCESQVGTCAACYGRSLATGKQVDIGEAVGIIAAQSIGEPGTQLTMRTFHTGGAASAADITQGLPRVQELFEARSPKMEAKMSEAAGRVHIDDEDPSVRRIIITRDDAKEDDVIEVSRRQELLVAEGEHVEAGKPLTEGQLDPKEIVRIMGRSVAQKQLVDEVQKVYRDQGVGIHAKHIEVIVRQMLRRITILEPGDTTFMPGELVDRMAYLAQNRKVAAEGGQPASGRQMLMGITKASLATDSWLSAASFQETTKVLTEAAMNGKSDSLVGLKENVILGKLIPAGTGLSRYNRVTVEPTAEALAASNYTQMDFQDGGVSEDFLDALGAIDFGMSFRE
ncbi:DNA-directed RNA polymerase subunit beta' [Actinomycetaceae bacterium UMB8039B]|uniref:DNA-directed RNA polymerase subunit beta' n=1 Tax=Pauljensenia sp. UMB8040A TaxID=3046343 RepID=UPI00254B7BCA|nr:DNA-directed RNA polymerase subunit beta' [Pauljensenia sp. UMB8040A]MDK7781180.1 DNA-directed RNA polymerase subunit beta' [Actinomycetaceae bacterium UMB8041B]MDK8294016.1 DNA-directed RNA polymerase subunit beta' [Actinomycetaceae bacterium UMB8039B]MDK8608910.1 DNA-directed RNA polymerase subunit beta' [Actinomycetaceae bacterium UMB8041A]MDK8753438.1 DNA-directed RNA polymerase subunit beta' [Actinomycetaceae bacterium UMB8039A]MDK6830731.1 DNA-directed RNA polymerase subunit beta' [Pa